MIKLRRNQLNICCETRLHGVNQLGRFEPACLL
jgi:hypothetical protein